jgi:hypothetical protein
MMIDDDTLKQLMKIKDSTDWSPRLLTPLGRSSTAEAHLATR